jgi:putative transposase
MIRWRRVRWKLFWRLKSRPGRPPIPPRIQALIRRIANENPSWGQERIADFLVAVTATFRLLYAFVVIEHRSRRLIHCNITAHPSATWTLQTAA